MAAGTRPPVIWSAQIGSHCTEPQVPISATEASPTPSNVRGSKPDATISLNDPADRKLRLFSREDFEKQWLATGQWTLLAVPRPQS